MQKLTLAAYRDRISARPGDIVNFKVSSYDGGRYRADLVRIESGNTLSGYTELDLTEVESSFAGDYAGRRQITQIGSCAVFDEAAPKSIAGNLTFCCAVMPTTAGRGYSALAVMQTNEGQVTLGVTIEGCLALTDSTGADWQLTKSLPLKGWSVVGFSLSGQNATLFQRPLPDGPGDPAHHLADEATFSLPNVFINVTMESLAARLNPEPGHLKTLQHFNGRIDAPRLFDIALSPNTAREAVLNGDYEAAENLIGWWDFSEDMAGRTFADRTPSGWHGEFRNLPTRAVTGVRWTGREHCWRHAPKEYSAVHFHEYALYDAEWETDFSYTIPANLPSGVYAARLGKAQGDTDETHYASFFVLPAQSAPRKDIAYLAPTASYLAYTNERLSIPLGELLDMDPPRLPEEQMLLDHPEFGLSMYDHHLDGLGVHFSSYLRPTINWQPGKRVWAFTADTDIVRWLTHNRVEFDTLTDEVLHQEGGELLDGYRVLITGTHPEYYSPAMRDAVEEFVQRGGRLMYLGGNGFYWRVAHSDSWPGAIELRRAEDGTRAWRAKPGEFYHQFDGELGGLWRRQGHKAPQQLTGVGFSAQGDGKGLRFRRGPGAADPRAAFAMVGVDEEIISDYKSMNMSCSGAEEVDRIDFSLGTPPHTLVLASSERRPAGLLRAKEETLLGLPSVPDPDIRADVVFFETVGGGAVFSTGSIGWSSVLAYNDYDNPTARVTTNVLRRFADPEPFEMPCTPADYTTLTPEAFQQPPGMRVQHLPWGELLRTAFSRCVELIGMSIIAKRRGLPVLPIAKPRDAHLEVDT